MKKKLFFLFIFFAIVVAFVVFWIYREGAFSKQVLRLEILGPEIANVGDEVEYTVKYKNNGNFSLESPKLVFDLPNDSISGDGKNQITKELDDIYPGDEDIIKIKARLIGKENDLKTAKAYLSYTPKNLTARYESDTTFTTKINEVPVTLDFDAPTKAEKGKDFQYSLNYFSNIDYALDNLAVKIAPTNGFEIRDATPSSLDNIEWKIKVLKKSEGGRIIIDGKVNSDASDKMTLSAQLGMWSNGNFVVIKESSVDVETTQSMLFISQQVNGSSDYVPSPGETLHYEVFFRNIGSSAFENLYMIVTLSGDAFDMSTLKSDLGQVQQSGNMIVWDWKDVPQLRKIDMQQESSLDFYVNIKDDWVPSSANSESALISNQVNVSQITKKFSLKVGSGLVVAQTAVLDGDNTKLAIGKESIYTISWNIINHSGDMRNVKIKGVLPDNVNLTGIILPTTEISNFTFDSNSRQIVWSAGDISSGVGVNGDPIGLSFQVALVPVSSQKGLTVKLIEKATITGESQFTNSTVTSSEAGVDTTLGGTVSGVVQ